MLISNDVSKYIDQADAKTRSNVTGPVAKLFQAEIKIWTLYTYRNWWKGTI